MIGALMSRGKAQAASALPASSRSATRSTCRSARSAPRRSMIPTSTATCCSSNASAMRRRCANSRSAPRRAASRSSPTSSAARRRRASWPSRTPARSPARTMWRARSWPIAASRASKASKACSRPCRWCGARRSARSARARRASRCVTTTAGGAIMVVDPLAMRGVEIAQPSAETFARLAAKGIEVDAGAHRRPHGRGRALRRDEGRARRPHHRARIRPGAGGGRLLGALPSRSGRAADHRQRGCRKADRGVPGARSARGAGAARARPACRASARPEACADAIAAALARREPKAGGRDADRAAAVACSTSSRPTRCSTGSACRARRRSRSTTTIAQAPALPFGYPVAVKVLSADIPHKTEAGGVALECPRRRRVGGRDQGDARDRASSAPASRRTACWSRR